jgi:hypothetical protein
VDAGEVAVEYLVRFTSAEGRDGHHSAQDLDSALQLAEHLRNTEEATDAQVYRLEPVPIRFKARYTVEVEQDDGEYAPIEGAPALPEAPPAALPEAPGAAPVASEDEAEDSQDSEQGDDLLVDNAGGSGLLSRS